MLNLKEASKVIGRVIQDITGIPFMVGQPIDGNLRPNGEYVSVTYQDSVSIGGVYRNYTKLDELNLTETIEEHRELRFSCNFYRGDCSQHSQQSKMAFKASKNLNKLQEGGMAYRVISNVTNFSEPLDVGWEQRSHFDITVGAVVSYSTEVASINAVSIEGEVAFPSGTFQIVIPINK